jgi:hypothetical protein
MKALLIFLACMVLSGCGWPFVKYVGANRSAVPLKQGTWTGVTETATISDTKGRPLDGIAVRIESGPTMTASDGSEYPMPADKKPLLVTEIGQALEPSILKAGQRVEVSGVMMLETPVYLMGSTPSFVDKPDLRVYGIRMTGTPKVIP